MLNVLDLAQEDTRLKKKATKEYSGPCPDPNCGCQRDGFSVRSNGYSWVFMCRGCWDSAEIPSGRDRKRGWGDEIAYLTHYRHITLDNAVLKAIDDGMLSFENAYKRYAYEKRWPYERAQKYLLELGADKDQKRINRPSQWKNKQIDHKSHLWQEQTHQAVEKYAANLWAEEGAIGLEYVRGRGLQDEIIRKARLGYSAQGGTPRLIIPLENFHFHDYGGGWYFTIFRRDLRPDCPREERWKNAKGSSTDELYMADCLRMRRPTVLTEGPLDALSVVQECSDLVNVVATAGVQCGQNVANLARLALMPLVLVAFDADTSGDKESKWWLERLPNARRLRPFLPDINDMLLDNWDIRAWIEQGMGKTVGTEATEMELLEQSGFFDQCHSCQCPFPDYEGRDVDKIPDSPMSCDQDGTPYCKQCRPDLFDIPSTAQTSTEEQFNARVQAVIYLIPGGCAMVTRQEPGYTLEQRVKDFEAEARQRQREAQYERIRRKNERREKALVTA